MLPIGSNTDTYLFEEIAIRFHHRLVSIHEFPNGNGKHARLMADILLEQNGESAFAWGRNTYQGIIEIEGSARKEYISSLRSADKNNYETLHKFT